MHAHPERAAGERWLLTDGRVYDWWDLASAWGDSSALAAPAPGADSDSGLALADAPSGPQPAWVRELMAEHGVHALPRTPAALGRCLDSREFWSTFGLSPAVARVERCERYGQQSEGGK